MTNLEDKQACIRYPDNVREPWKINCESVERLSKIADIIMSCQRVPGIERTKVLTSQTSEEIVVQIS